MCCYLCYEMPLWKRGRMSMGILFLKIIFKAEQLQQKSFRKNNEVEPSGI